MMSDRQSYTGSCDGPDVTTVMSDRQSYTGSCDGPDVTTVMSDGCHPIVCCTRNSMGRLLVVLKEFIWDLVESIGVWHQFASSSL